MLSWYNITVIILFVLLYRNALLPTASCWAHFGLCLRVAASCSTPSTVWFSGWLPASDMSRIFETLPPPKSLPVTPASEMAPPTKRPRTGTRCFDRDRRPVSKQWYKVHVHLTYCVICDDLNMLDIFVTFCSNMLLNFVSAYTKCHLLR